MFLFSARDLAWGTWIMSSSFLVCARILMIGCVDAQTDSQDLTVTTTICIYVCCCTIVLWFCVVSSLHIIKLAHHRVTYRTSMHTFEHDAGKEC